MNEEATRFLNQMFKKEQDEVNRLIRNWVHQEVNKIIPGVKFVLKRDQIIDLIMTKCCNLNFNIDCQRVPLTEKFTRSILVYDGQQKPIVNKEFHYDLTRFYNDEHGKENNYSKDFRQ